MRSFFAHLGTNYKQLQYSFYLRTPLGTTVLQNPSYKATSVISVPCIIVVMRSRSNTANQKLFCSSTAGFRLCSDLYFVFCFAQLQYPLSLISDFVQVLSFAAAAVSVYKLCGHL